MDVDGPPRCPHCGHFIIAPHSSAATARRSVRAAMGTRRLGNTVSNFIGAKEERVEIAPNTKRKETIEEPVMPVTLALWGTPLANALTAWGAAVIFITPTVVKLTTWPAPFFIAHTIGGILFAIIWRADRLHFGDAIIKSKNVIESALNIDLDKDVSIGKPPERNVSITIEERRGNNTLIKYLCIPLSENKMVAVAQAIADGESFSRPGLCDRAGAVSQTEYHKLSNWMLERGLLVKLPGNQRDLTSIGRKMFSKLLDAPAPELV